MGHTVLTLPDKKTFRKVTSSVVFPISLGSSSSGFFIFFIFFEKSKFQNIPSKSEQKYCSFDGT